MVTLLALGLDFRNRSDGCLGGSKFLINGTKDWSLFG